MATTIQIDASAHCQLACPSCPTASGETRKVMGAGHLDVGRFEALLAGSPELLEVELSNYGEMFLNPRLHEILRIAHKRKVVLHADNGVNLNHVSEETLESLVRYRFRSMTVSIDGASPESYAKYRVRGDFTRVIGHIRKLNDFKRAHGTVFPLLTWQFIVFGHNEHEIAAARQLARELGMGFRPKISWDDDVSPVRNKELVRIQTGLAATRDEHHQATGTSYMRSLCYGLWHSPVINWDGRVMGCCRNFWRDFGSNAFEEGLERSLGSPLLDTARRMLMGHAEPSPGVPCTTCDLYLDMRKDGTWITEKELERGEPGVVLGVTVERGEGSEATHADAWIGRGPVNRSVLGERQAAPATARRYRFGDIQNIAFVLPPDVECTLNVLPRRLDPTLRVRYPAMPVVTLPLKPARRPVVQEVRVIVPAS